jgi:hypothetical protein
MTLGARREDPHAGEEGRISDADASANGRTGPVDPLGDGTVTGAPRRWLRLEGATLLVGSLIAYSTTDQAWWLVPLVILVPDLTMTGYLGGARLGARLYNLAHTTPLPAALIAIGWWQDKSLVVGLGLIWLAHIGFDRLLGYGLKYSDHFHHTHLGRLGPKSRGAEERPRG